LINICFYQWPALGNPQLKFPARRLQ
jgi:hypothetical protein